MSVTDCAAHTPRQPQSWLIFGVLQKLPVGVVEVLQIALASDAQLFPVARPDAFGARPVFALAF